MKLLDELCINLEKAAGEKEKLKEESDELGQTIAVILGEIQKVDANMDRNRWATSVSALLAAHIISDRLSTASSHVLQLNLKNMHSMLCYV